MQDVLCLKVRLHGVFVRKRSALTNLGRKIAREFPRSDGDGMAPPFQIDLDSIDFGATCIDRDEIYTILPHAHEFRLLDGVCMVDSHKQHIVAYADIKEDDWWVRGHVPGMPLLPGVLMLEMAAQTSAILAKSIRPDDAFIGFGGVGDCKFRQSVTPGSRLVILGVGQDFRARRIVCRTQGVVDGRLVFEAVITGMILR